MGSWDTLLLWLHFLSLGLGGAAVFGGLVVAAAIPKAAAEARPPLVGVRGRLVNLGRVGLALLILTGVLMARANGALGFWFWIKMLLVLALTASVLYAVPLGRRAMGGDAAAIARMGQIVRLNLGLYVAIILAAVLAFG